MFNKRQLLVLFPIQNTPSIPFQICACLCSSRRLLLCSVALSDTHAQVGHCFNYFTFIAGFNKAEVCLSLLLSFIFPSFSSFYSPKEFGTIFVKFKTTHENPYQNFMNIMAFFLILNQSIKNQHPISSFNPVFFHASL